MCRFRTFAALLIIIEMYLACDSRNAQPKKPVAESTATISLSAVTNSSRTEVFHEVKQASLLPSAVLDALGGMADPGQPFNNSDALGSNLPMQRLIVAAVSENYCIVSYWQGGISLLALRTSIFKLSAGRAKRIWLSSGQGGLNFWDLKEMVESGRMKNDLEKPKH